MNKKIDTINALISSLESRNEKLHEELKRNEQSIEELKEELSYLIRNNDFEIPEEIQLEMAI